MHWIFKAAPPKRIKSKVPNAHKAKRIDALARRMGASVSADFLDGIETFKRRISREALMEAWKSGQYDQLNRHIPWDKLDDDMAPFQSGLGSALFDASLLGFDHLPPTAKKMRWDIQNPKIRNYIQTQTGNLVRGIKHDTKVQLRDLVTRSFTHALTPKQIADEIKGSLGLHDRYRAAVKNYKNQLIEDGKSDKVVDDLTQKYEKRLLNARALAVGKTETRRATNHGQRAVWKEAAEQGYIDKQTTKRIYVVDGSPCDICEPLDGMETTLDEPYPGGFEPGEVHPNCECTEILETG